MKTIEENEPAPSGLALLAPKAEKLRSNMHEAGGAYLPRFKIFHPAEGSDNTHVAAVCFGQDVTLLEKPYRIAALACRKMIRESYVNDKEQNVYRYAYEDGNSHARYNEWKGNVTKEKDCKFKNGKSYLVAVFPGDGSCVVASLDVVGGSLWYWERPLSKADAYDGGIIQVNIVDHKPNYSKEYKGWESKKFTQYEQFQITKEEMGLANETAKQVESALKNWLER